MKNLILYSVVFSLLFSCSTREENEVEISDDPNFQPQTQEFLIDDSAEITLHSCYFENNDLKLIYSGSQADAYHWLRKNAMGEYIILSTEKYIKIAQVGAFKLVTFKGQDSLVRNISIYTCPSSIEAVPASFTPNKDGQFDTWAPIGDGIKKIKFTITSMDNEKLFESESLDVPWDGTFNGKPVPTGSYRYKVEGTLINGKAFTYRGILSLSR
ncbi:MAG: T9SS type B sorting domain-containing protein [Bacteroidetes bacterium]|nr:T9SS type B sorting domain-containing protein [Bacteroidota bacterium]